MGDVEEDRRGHLLALDRGLPDEDFAECVSPDESDGKTRHDVISGCERSVGHARPYPRGPGTKSGRS